jgi:CubicO group peptidase (beta-lactamase class C family)
MRILLLAGLAPALFAAGVGEDAEVRGAQRLYEAWMRGQMARRGLPGVVVGVVHDQELIWARAFGKADLEAGTPLEVGSKFRMASHSKLFTATAVMQLRDEGKLRLDDPVRKYLPWFEVEPVEPGDGEITIEELLTHGSGLPREAGAHWTELDFPDAEGVKKYIRERKAVFPPEVRFKYSNLALTVAGMVVEAVSGEPYAAYVQRNIFDPLGMKDSSFDRDVPGLARGYGRRMPDGTRQKFGFVDARAMAPATGLTSTVGDMAKFVSAQFRKGPRGGAQIVSTGGLRRMHRVRLLENNWTSGYGIGFSVRREKDRVYVGHGGSYPGYTTQTYIQLDDKVGVLVLTNASDSEPAAMAMELMQTVGAAVARVAKKEAEAGKSVTWDPSWGRFAGLYRSRGQDTAVVELDRRLVMIDTATATLANPMRLEPLGGGRFRLDAQTGGAPVGEVVRFEERGGRVVRMYLGDGYSERVEP